MIILVLGLIIISAILLIAYTSSSNFILTPQQDTVSTAKVIQDEEPQTPAESCEGSWINSSFTGKIDLLHTSLSDWKYESPPAIISETLNSENTVVIGHNYCTNGNCNVPGTNFSQIINMKSGDEVNFCLAGKPYGGYVLRCGDYKNTDMFLLWNWTGFDSVTFFTSYGTCADSACSSTDKRWVCVIEKN